MKIQSQRKDFFLHNSLSFQCIIIHMCILYHLFQLNLNIHMFSIFFLHVENLVLVVQFWPVSSFCTNLCFVIVKAFFLFLYLCFYCWDFWFSVRWSRYGVLWGKLTNKKKKEESATRDEIQNCCLCRAYRGCTHSPNKTSIRCTLSEIAWLT